MRRLTGLCVVLLLAMMAPPAVADYLPGMLNIRMRADGAAKAAVARAMFDQFGAIDSQPAFRFSGPIPAAKISAEAMERRDALARIERVSFPEDLDMELVAAKLRTIPGVEFAEPVYAMHMQYLPNDTRVAADQEYLSVISAPEAWDVARGDSTVTVAIVDSGTGWDHADLAANRWTNPGEIPGNGVDDDGNGYVDDVHGWDFWGGTDFHGYPIGDNDPASTVIPHGTHTAGIAAAVTDNGIGIASLSFNVRFMAVKVSADQGENLALGFNGIVYAAENGADVINCSWGALQYSQTGADAVAYATSLGAIVVASAGNDGTNQLNYPASYPEALSVGSVELNGLRSTYSNYGPTVDVYAPGSYILSTVFNNTYGYMSGTSMAAPVVSALAALLKSARPGWDADQIRAQISGTSNPLTLSDRETYLCGCGIIDAARALGPPVLHIDVTEYAFTDSSGNNDGLFLPGEDLEAWVTLHNYGEAAGNVSMSVSSLLGYVQPGEQLYTIGNMEHGGEFTVGGIGFTVVGDAPFDAHDILRLDFQSSAGSNYAVIDVVVNPSFATFTANTIEVSVDGMGHIGYIDFPENTRGAPFVVHNRAYTEADSLLFEGGIMFGNGPDRISDSLRGDIPGLQDREFELKRQFRFEGTVDHGAQEGTVTFNDDGAGAEAYGVSVTSRTYAFGEEGHDQYVIFGYIFRNNGAQAIENFRAGMFLDFDISPPDFSGPVGSNDIAMYTSDDFVATYDSAEDPDTALVIGVASAGPVGVPFIIGNSGSGGSPFGIYDGFSEAEKWAALSTAFQQNTPVSSDLSIVVSPEPFTLEPGRDYPVAFVIGYGRGYDELSGVIARARVRANGIDDLRPVRVAEGPEPREFAIDGVYPNPFNPTAMMRFTLPDNGRVTVRLYDVLGRRVRTIHDGYRAAGVHEIRVDGAGLASGVYFIGLEDSRGHRAFEKVTLMK